MRQIALWLLLIGFTLSAACQQTDPLPEQHRPNTDYLQKSKSQRTAGWILAGAGATGLLLTLVTDIGHTTADAFTTVFSLGTVEPKGRSFTAGYLLSAAGMAGGVYLVARSGKNRRRATATVALQLETALQEHRGYVSRIQYPAAALRLGLK